PASVIKELIENSIDAGAANIVIEIENAGLKRINVTDDGHGIMESELDKVFLKHATSKIKTEKDLEKIGSLGFRGEALASIASVSEVTLTTKHKYEEVATRVILKGNEIKKKEPAKHQTGTTFEVKNLFGTVPARLKFLKTTRTEEGECVSLVEKFILANPHITFGLACDEKTRLLHKAGTLQDAICSIYGREIGENVIKVEHTKNNLALIGYVCVPSVNKRSRNYQHIAVNSRFINNQTITSAVERAFEPYLMHGQRPVFVLDLKIDASLVDVNIHPRKTEVRFHDNQEIFKFVYAAVTNAILAYQDKKSTEQFSDSGFIEAKPAEKTLKEKISESVSELYGLTKDNGWESVELGSQTEFEISVGVAPKGDPQKEDKFDIFQTLECNYTRLFNTFILIEKEDKILIIDEHAMHERLIFDKLEKEILENSMSIQPLLVPFVFTVTNKERESIEKNMPIFKQLGFDISEFGDLTYRISEIPSILTNIKLDKFKEEITNKEFMAEKSSDVLREKLKRIACRLAVKAGQKLIDADIQNLNKQFMENTLALNCPHGRPTVVEIKKSEIEKWFKRKL
ncbi:MAG: DNA mismatch repair endonuclease MutL, partial [Firmicutes bacterium]|nr:DNA mismatch repair endonuclease MutL [Bacillota bacterium]